MCCVTRTDAARGGATEHGACVASAAARPHLQVQVAVSSTASVLQAPPALMPPKQ